MKRCSVYAMRRLRNALIKIKIFISVKINRIGLRERDFTIISNNCWGGDVYQMFGLEYKSPTIGLFLYESDYVQFVRDIKKYMNSELVFIDPRTSKYYHKLCAELGEAHVTFPIAKLLDVEIMFLHYSSQKEAIEKWNRRKKRINYNKILYKISDRTDSSENIIRKFDSLPLKNKIIFSKKKYDGVNSIVVPELAGLPNGITEKDCTMRYCNVKKIINNIK